MVNDESHEIPLRYGRNDGTMFSGMPNLLYCVGYNNRFGLVDIMEDNGTPFFEGRINIESMLKQMRLNGRNQEGTDSEIEKYIMKAYGNTIDGNGLRKSATLTPTLEILSYKG